MDEDHRQQGRLGQVILRRETWAYALGKFCIDPIWWFFLFWLPGYLGTRNTTLISRPSPCPWPRST